MGRSKQVVFSVTDPSTALVLLRGQLEWMIDRGWQVHVITGQSSELAERARRSGFTFHPINMRRELSPLHDILCLIKLAILFSTIRPFAAHFSTPKAALLCSFAAWVTRVPTRVYMVRGLRLEGSSNGAQRRILWLAERATVQFSNRVVAVSHSLATAMAAQKLCAIAPIVVGQGSSNGVDIDQVQKTFAASNRVALRATRGIRPSDFLVLFVGRITKDKGVVELVEALTAGAAVNSHLLTVGVVEDESMVSELQKLGPRWHRESWMSNVASTFAEADVLCLPTHREGFPNVVLEASAAGLACVTTNATGAVDSVISGVTGLVVPVGDYKALGNALQFCERNPALLREWGSNAKERVATNFAQDIVWSGYESILGVAWAEYVATKGCA